MTTLSNLSIGTIIVYSSPWNPDVEYVVLNTVNNDSGTFVNLMNLNSKEIESLEADTELGFLWNLKK